MSRHSAATADARLELGTSSSSRSCRAGVPIPRPSTPDPTFFLFFMPDIYQLSIKRYSVDGVEFVEFVECVDGVECVNAILRSAAVSKTSRSNVCNRRCTNCSELKTQYVPVLRRSIAKTDPYPAFERLWALHLGFASPLHYRQTKPSLLTWGSR